MNNQRGKLIFKINGVKIMEHSLNIDLNEIDRIKNVLAQEMECTTDEIEMYTIQSIIELSDEVDCGCNGLIFWKGLYPDPIRGVFCELEIGSDAYLDAVSKGTLDDYLHFFI